MALADIVRALQSESSHTAVFSDFDGTLSHIVDDPDTVTPIDGAVDCLTELTNHVGIVAVISGRPVAFLEQFFSSTIELSGLYGLEHRTGERLLVDPTALEWFPVMSKAADDARIEFGPEAVEDKQYSITVHYRGAGEGVAAAVANWADRTAAESGLEARSAKMSVELHPPSSRSKGDAVEDLLATMTSAIYLGDDVGDLPAFRRLAGLHASGALDSYAAVLVDSDEAPEELRWHATDVVDSPEGAVALLQSLLAAATET